MMADTSDDIVSAVKRATETLKEAAEHAKLLDGALRAHDAQATVLTEARKVLRDILDRDASRVGTFGQTCVNATDRIALVAVIDKLNTCIIASRKLVKGELP